MRTKSTRSLISHTKNSSERDMPKDNKTTKMTWSYLTTIPLGTIIDILIATQLSLITRLPK